MPLDKIQRATRNPKDHDLGEIHKSIDRFGFIQPTLMNETTGRLVAGHGRLDALIQKKMRGEKPPKRVIEQNGSWLIPVIRGVSFSTDQEAEAYLLADNNLTILGGWDDPMLVDALSDLAAKGDQMLQGTGFDLDDLDELMRKLDKEMDQSATQDEDQVEVTQKTEELLAKYGNKPGDIWQIGDHTLITADSRDTGALESLLNASGLSSYDGVFTSPPYAEQRSKKMEWYGGISEEEYPDWWNAVQENAAKYLTPAGSFFLNIKPNVVEGARTLYVFDLVTRMVREWQWLLIDEFCWERNGAPGKWHNRFKNGFEPVYQFCKTIHCNFFPDNVAEDRAGQGTHSGNASTGNYYNISHKTVSWEEVLPSNRIPNFGNAIGAMHPAAFPVGLPAFFMRAFSERGSTWLDPFSGSATVGIAAHRTGRRSLMIELEPRYVAVSLERMSIATGETPEKVGEYATRTVSEI